LYFSGWPSAPAADAEYRVPGFSIESARATLTIGQSQIGAEQAEPVIAGEEHCHGTT